MNGAAWISDQDHQLQLELRNKAVRRAARRGLRYGTGISMIVSIASAHVWGHNWGWLIPAVIAGFTFGPLLSDLFTWMEIQQQERRDR